MGKKLFLVLISIMFITPLIIAEDTYSDCSVYGNCQTSGIVGTVSGNVNYSTVNVNNSNYLEGYNVSSLWTYYSGLGNALWCKLTGCTMQGDIDMDNNNIYNIGNIYNKTEVDNNITANSGDSNVAVINNMNSYSTVTNVNNSSFPSTALINNIIYSDSTYNETYAKRPYLNVYDNSTQNFLNTSATQIINISNNNDYDNYLINVEGQQNLTFKQTGDYLCMLTPEFYNTASTAQIAFWYQKTNSTGKFNDVAWSNSRFTMGNAEYDAPLIPFQFDIEDSSRKVRFMWYSTSTNSQIISIAPPTSPDRPGIPGIILNCQKVSELT